MFRVRIALLISCLTPTAAIAAQGTVSLGPDWAPEPKVYASTGDLMADSLGLAWDGEAPVIVRLEIIEVINGSAERFVTGDTLTLAPGSRLIRLQDLVSPMVLGDELPVVRWAQASGVIEPRELTVDRWDNDLFPTLRGEELAINWETDAVLVIGMRLEGPGQPEEVFTLPFLVVRPAPKW